MKKVLFTLLCCTLFAVGCSKAAQQEEAVDNMGTEATEVAPAQDGTAVNDAVATSTETVAQPEGEVK